MNKLKEILKKDLNIGNMYIFGILIVSLVVIMGSFSYAIFTTSSERKGALTMVTGSLNSLIASDSFNDNKEVSVAANSIITINIKLTNPNSISAKFNLYYSATSTTGLTVGYLNNGDSAPDSNGVVLPAYGTDGYEKNIIVKINNSSASAVTLTFGSDVVLSTDTITLKDGKTLISSYPDQPNAPELIGDMIPVVYDDTNSTWIKASTTNGSWYDYDNQKWANAVTISDTTKRATYKSAAVGTAVLMDDINAMFVWIPRYSYTIGNTYGVQGYGGSTPSQATPGAIDIKFVSTSTTETGTATYTGGTASNYYTSPAFCWGDTCDSSRTDATNVEKSGIWVGKFENTAGATSTCTTTSNTTNCNLSTIVPVIKPNITSWRYVQVANMFTAIQTNMNGTNGTINYGFSGTTYDTHMMKNTEWGAVAYLSQSKYGKYGNTTYSGADKEVADTNNMNNTAEVTTSTTGNISGIYGMSGGAYEYVMGNMQVYGNTKPQVGYNSSNTSGFAGTLGDFTSVTGITFPSNKYYNKYTYGTSTDYTRGILGDATKEMSPASYKTWYSDTAAFVADYLSWFKRGGGGSLYNVTDAGVFNFNYDGGSADSYISGRVVIEP